MAQRIIILGGGMAGLTTAMALTRDAGRRSAFDVTVYQDGWLLGGKGASVRNRDRASRIEEHGLHLWLGFYENAFRLIRETYGELGRTPDQPLATWQDAFTPWDDVTLMEREDDGRYTRWPLKPPRNDELPGDGDDMPAVDELAGRAIRLMLAILGTTIEQARAIRSDSVSVMERLRDLLSRLLGQLRDLGTIGAVSSAVLLLRLRSRGPNGDPNALADLLDGVRRKAFALVAGRIERDPLVRRMWIVFELQLVNLSGMVRDGLLAPDADFAKLDDLDFRDWLRAHGASQMTAESTLVRGLYNLAFSTPDGGAAGTCLVGTMRFLLAYRGALLYRMTAGMGEVVFSPLYLVLRRRGVRFEFFHRVKHLGVDASRSAIDRVVIARQARIRGGGEYQPLIDVDGLPCWPERPLFDQLEDGDALRARVEPGLGTFGTLPELEDRELRAGRDFDLVVLAISVAALPRSCGELIAARPRWRAMVDGIKTIQTVAMQLWFERDTAALGWGGPQPLIGSFEAPHETFADMSHLLRREPWEEPRPRGLGYFCGTIDDGDAPLGGPLHERARRESVAWLDDHAHALFPSTRTANGFDRSVLFDPSGASGDARLAAQYVRANTEPSDRYVLSVPGTTKHRLWPDESGFSNLVLAGDWTRTGLDAGCIEAAVMSGAIAARSITGTTERIAGEAARPHRRSSVVDAGPALPHYVERPHELALRPPYLLRDTQLYSFVLRADRGVLQRRIDDELPHLRGDAIVAAPVVVLAAAFAARASSLDPLHVDRGITTEIDVGFWVPVVMRRRTPGLCWYLPFVFVDAPAAMVAGREIYGFPKIIAEVQREAVGPELRALRLATQVVTTFGAAARVERRTLIELARAPGGAPRRLSSLAFPTPRMSRARLLFTKQVRDVEHVDRAALSQAVTAEAIVRELRDARATWGRTTIRILRTDSHPIVRHLGLAHRPDGDADVIETGFQGFADFDFTLELGKVMR